MKKKTVTLKDYIMAISIFLIALVVGIFIFYSGVQHSIKTNSQEKISLNVSRQSEHLRTIFDIKFYISFSIIRINTIHSSILRYRKTLILPRIYHD